jgi:hypothetical protein
MESIEFFVTAFPKNSLLLLAAIIMSREYSPMPRRYIDFDSVRNGRPLRAYAVFPTDIAGRSGFVLSVTEKNSIQVPSFRITWYAKSASLSRESRYLIWSLNPVTTGIVKIGGFGFSQPFPDEILFLFASELRRMLVQVLYSAVSVLANGSDTPPKMGYRAENIQAVEQKGETNGTDKTR